MGLDAAAATSSALAWGLYPFMVGDLLKAAIAGLAIPAAAAIIGRK
jgi:biotin transporter BioY